VCEVFKMALRDDLGVQSSCQDNSGPASHRPSSQETPRKPTLENEKGRSLPAVPPLAFEGLMNLGKALQMEAAQHKSDVTFDTGMHLNHNHHD
jgi:hypothetical protein